MSSVPPATATGAAFDRAAPFYDETFESRPGTVTLRRRVHRVLLRTFRPGDVILELNAGTGTDAVALAAYGIRVHATDISSAMIDILQAKARSAGVEHLVTSETLPFDRLSGLHGRLFDGALSDMGGINCTSDLASLGRDLARVVKPGGAVILVFMPSCSLWESASFLLRGNVRAAFRRGASGPVAGDLHGTRVAVWYHSIGAVRRAMNEGFSHERSIGLNVVTPPPASETAQRVLRPLLPALSALERVIGSLPGVRGIGDHCLMILRRRRPSAETPS